MRVDMLQQAMRNGRRTGPAAPDGFADFAHAAPAPARAMPLSSFASTVVSAADAVAIAAELARAQRQIQALQQENAQLRAALAQHVRAADSDFARTTSAAPAQRRRAASTVIDVTGGGARTVAAPQPSTTAGPQPGSVEVAEPEAPPQPSAADVAWFGDHLKGSEPADFSEYEDLESDLGLG